MKRVTMRANNIVSELFEDAGVKKMPMGDISKKMRTLTILKRNGMENEANKSFEELKSIKTTDGVLIKDLEAEASLTQDHLLGKLNSKRPEGKPGYVEEDVPSEISSAVPNILSPAERKALARVYTRKFVQENPDLEYDMALLRHVPKKPDRVLEFSTYGDLDTARREVGKAMKSGMFTDEDMGTLNTLYGKLAEDQLAVIRKNADKLPEGTLDNALKANALVKARKALEDDMKAFFSKTLDADLQVTDINKAFKQGLTSKLQSRLNAFPEGEQKELFLNSMMYVLSDGTSLSTEKMAKIMPALQENQGFNRMLKKYVGEEGSKMMDAIADVSKHLYDVVDENALKGKHKGASTEWFESMFGNNKSGLLRSAMEMIIPYYTGSLFIRGGATDTAAQGMQRFAGQNAYNNTKQLIKNAGKDHAARARSILESDELKELLTSDLGEVAVAKFSNAQKIKNLFDQAGIARSSTKIAELVNTAFRLDELREGKQDGN